MANFGCFAEGESGIICVHIQQNIKFTHHKFQERKIRAKFCLATSRIFFFLLHGIRILKFVSEETLFNLYFSWRTSCYFVRSELFVLVAYGKLI